ncbi:MAG TPA: prepilin-type N-terminal cleavage/methylation domain-containing protein [Gemmatimonadaceae bacterium]|jgi:prepilin-type N-terminal cleavage/methylation domain-containing protein|nr:prepilin-type N-terminal cleavage/methylation domain-containing protein [Gemmatimonadaceae bacterium]
MRRSAFTLIELVVAITLSGIVLLGARALWESLAASLDRLRAHATADTRSVNGERLLRSLMGRLEIGTDQSREFAGDEHQVQFTTWCDMPAGWQERCDAVIGIEPDTGTGLALVAHLSTGEVIALQRGFTTGALRYLNDPIGGGVWFRIWGHGITAPLAIGVVTDGDTAIVRIGERG